MKYLLSWILSVNRTLTTASSWLRLTRTIRMPTLRLNIATRYGYHTAAGFVHVRKFSLCRRKIDDKKKTSDINDAQWARIPKKLAKVEKLISNFRKCNYCICFGKKTKFFRMCPIPELYILYLSFQFSSKLPFAWNSHDTLRANWDFVVILCVYFENGVWKSNFAKWILFLKVCTTKN